METLDHIADDTTSEKRYDMQQDEGNLFIDRVFFSKRAWESVGKEHKTEKSCERSFDPLR